MNREAGAIILEADVLDMAITSGGCGVCLGDGAIVALTGEKKRLAGLTPDEKSQHQGHTILPIPTKTPEDEQRDIEAFCTWVAAQPDTTYSPDQKGEMVARVRQRGDLWKALHEITRTIDVPYAEHDSVDDIRQQLIRTLNQQADPGITFLDSDDIEE